MDTACLQYDCSKCKNTLPVSHFSVSNLKIYGTRKKANQVCKLCIKERDLKSRYKITSLEERLMISTQESKCKICDKTEKLCVDHCHTTRKIRGLLCHSCNLGIGKFRDSPLLLRKAADYIESILI
jgi:hypothetical protein